MEEGKTQWKSNFDFKRAGYTLMSPITYYGVEFVQRAILGESHPLFMEEHFCILEGVDLNGYYFKEHELQAFIEEILRIFSEEPKRVEELHVKAYQLNADFFNFAREHQDDDFSAMGDKELGVFYAEIVEKLELAHLTATSTTWFIDSEDQKLSKILLSKTKELVERSGNDLDYASIFSTLTTLPKNTFALDEELESLKVLQKISLNEGERN